MSPNSKAASWVAPGTLYLVATPIGNLSDISERAKAVLAGVDFILAEDSRHTGMLLQRLEIPKKEFVSYFNFNERERVPEIVERLKGGNAAALVSDAGTPGISDPGFRVVSACQAAGVKVVAVPGPCAAVAALAISGLPTNRFLFEGFLPPKGAKRERKIDELLAMPWTVVVYESTHKIEKLMEELAAKAPDREVVICRELTKIYEETLRGTAAQLKELVAKRGGLKGEMVVIIAGAEDLEGAATLSASSAAADDRVSGPSASEDEDPC